MTDFLSPAFQQIGVVNRLAFFRQNALLLPPPPHAPKHEHPALAERRLSQELIALPYFRRDAQILTSRQLSPRKLRPSGRFAAQNELLLAPPLPDRDEIVGLVSFGEIRIAEHVIRCRVVFRQRQAAESAHPVAAQQGKQVRVRQQVVVVDLDGRFLRCRASLEQAVLGRGI